MVIRDVELSEAVKQQYMDNIDWIKHAHQHNLVRRPSIYLSASSIDVIVIGTETLK